MTNWKAKYKKFITKKKFVTMVTDFLKRKSTHTTAKRTAQYQQNYGSLIEILCPIFR